MEGFSIACPWPRFTDYLPFLKWLPKYSLAHAKGDIIAGLTVGLMVVPQSLAYATIAGLPIAYGLYAATMGPFVYVLLGSAKDITLGPTAIMSLIVAGAAGGNIQFAIALSFIAGCMQVIMGLLRLGFVVDFISFPVISGFCSSAALNIAFGQVKHLLGLHGVRRPFLECVHDTFAFIKQWQPYDLLIGVICIFILVCMKKMKEKYGKTNAVAWFVGTARNAIVVVIAGLVGYALMSTDTVPPCDKHQPHTQSCMTPIGHMQSGLPKPDVPVLTDFGAVAVKAIVVALIGYLESIAIGKAFARQNGYVVDASQELIAIGGANIIGSFFDAYPATGSFSRTAVNSASGVMTPAGGLLTGLLVLLATQFMTSLFYWIPYAALSAVIMSAVIQMFEWEVVPHMWKASKLDLLPLIASFCGCLFWAIEYGMLVAIGISLVILVAQHMIQKPQGGDEEELPAMGTNIAVHRLRGFNFPAVNSNMAKIEKLLRTSEAQALIIDMHSVRCCDFTALQGLGNLGEENKRNNVLTYITHVKPEIVNQLEALHFTDLIVCDSLAAAAAAAAIDITESQGAVVEGKDNGKDNDRLLVGITDYGTVQ